MQINAHDVVVRAGGQLYVVRVDSDGGQQTPRAVEPIAQSDRAGFDRDFDAGVMLALPQRRGDEVHPYRVDLDRLNDQVVGWAGARSPVGAPTDTTSESPDWNDVVLLVKNDAHDVWFVKVDGGRDGQPLALDTATAPRPIRNYASRLAVRNQFGAGMVLGYLQQTPDPVGATCYMLNLEAFAGDELDPKTDR
jgi:hypothetical protein